MKRVLIGAVAALVNMIAITDRAIAQVVPDNTLGTQVTQTGLVFGINNGTRSGNNLFHSFSQFSVPTNGSAIFNNATDVQNIFSRITGSQLSNIDGILKTQGGANLFLMNPNGIIFGPNAKLELGESFLGTTASSMKFSDAIEFNTVNSTPALLSVNVPIGLQMGTVSGALVQPAVGIVVQGPGHSLRHPAAQVAIIGAGQSQNGLSVLSGKTLALVGGDVTLSGGVLSTHQGRIEVGSVGQGMVGISSVPEGWQLEYGGISDWRDIQLTRRSVLDASGMGGSSIQVAGRQIQLSDGSGILIQNQGTQPDRLIRIQASESLSLQGTSPNNYFASILSETVNTGTGANIDIITPKLTLQDNARITSFSSQTGTAGNINITSEQIVVDGKLDRFGPIRTSIVNSASGTGRSGDTIISTQQLMVLNGGLITTAARGITDGRPLTINASEFVEVNGANLSPSGQPSLISSSSLSRGNASQLTINTANLRVLNSGQISVSALAQGNAGNLVLNIADRIDVAGTIKGFEPSSIDASATIVPPLIRSLLRVPDVPSGQSGNVEITTRTLRLSDGGSVLARNQGLGGAGKITIYADTLELLQQGKIAASSVSGQGGDIILNASKILLLRQDSQISTESGGLGNGGNITIDAPIIVGLENSDIIANAVKGKGGNIQITTDSLFGLQYRDRLTSDNEITASSEFGINGNVQVNTIGINPANSLNTLPIDVVDSSRQIADRCGAAKTSSFIATGRGGMPQGPSKKKGSNRTWHDIRTNSLQASSIVTPISQNTSQPIVEATAFQIDKSGSIELVTTNHTTSTNSDPATCAIGETGL
jgi:filamentous hemagglutinin family protein